MGAMTAFPAFSSEPKSILCSVNTCSLNSFYLATGRAEPIDCLDGAFLLEVSIEGGFLKMHGVGPVKRERDFFDEFPLQTADPSLGEYRALLQNDVSMAVAALDVFDEWSVGEFTLTAFDLRPFGDTTVIAGTCEEEA